MSNLETKDSETFIMFHENIDIRGSHTKGNLGHHINVFVSSVNFPLKKGGHPNPHPYPSISTILWNTTNDVGPEYTPTN